MAIHNFLQDWVDLLKKRIDHWTYLPFLFFLMIADLFLVVIPIDGLFIGQIFLRPKRWFAFTVIATIGSALGGVMIYQIIRHYGPVGIESLFPGMMERPFYVKAEDFFQSYGVWFLFLVAATPFAQQPGLVLAGLASLPLFQVVVAFSLGRFVKYTYLSYLAYFTPALVKRFWRP